MTIVHCTLPIVFTLIIWVALLIKLRKFRLWNLPLPFLAKFYQTGCQIRLYRNETRNKYTTAFSMKKQMEVNLYQKKRDYLLRKMEVNEALVNLSTMIESSLEATFQFSFQTIYVIPFLFLNFLSIMSSDPSLGGNKLSDLFNIRLFSILLSFGSFAFSICTIRDRDKGGALELLHNGTLLLKIVLEANARIIIFSCFLYVINYGQFSTYITAGFFYILTAILILFHSIFNRNKGFSFENCIGVILNGFSSMITFTNMNYVAMFDMIKNGRVSRRNEDWHESTMVKQIVYNFIIFTVYLSLTVFTLAKMDETMRLIDVNGIQSDLSMWLLHFQQDGCFSLQAFSAI